MTKISFLTKCFILLGLVSACAVLQAQDSGGLNNTSLLFPYPETGAWSQQDGSNTGFFFEIQNGRVGAAWFGFDGQGDNAWVVFAGDLQPLFNDNQSQIGWRLSAPLSRSVNGGCILDCQDVSDGMFDRTAVGQIEIDFIGRSVATFSVDGAESSQIVPMAFGSGGFVEFPEASDLLLPVLTGVWVARNANGSTLHFQIGARTTDGTGDDKQISYPVTVSAGVDSLTGLADVSAQTDVICEIDNQSNEPVCEMLLPAEVFLFSGIGTSAARMKLQDISDSRINFKVNIGGSPTPQSNLITLFRIDYD